MKDSKENISDNEDLLNMIKSYLDNTDNKKAHYIILEKLISKIIVLEKDVKDLNLLVKSSTYIMHMKLMSNISDQYMKQVQDVSRGIETGICTSDDYPEPPCYEDLFPSFDDIKKT